MGRRECSDREMTVAEEDRAEQIGALIWARHTDAARDREIDEAEAQARIRDAA